MARRVAFQITIAFVAAVAVGCATAPSRFYTLNSPATPRCCARPARRSHGRLGRCASRGR